MAGPTRVLDGLKWGWACLVRLLVMMRNLILTLFTVVLAMPMVSGQESQDELAAGSPDANQSGSGYGPGLEEIASIDTNDIVDWACELLNNHSTSSCGGVIGAIGLTYGPGSGSTYCSNQAGSCLVLPAFYYERRQLGPGFLGVCYDGSGQCK